MKTSKMLKGFVIGAVVAFVISGSLIVLSKDNSNITDDTMDYEYRFYKEGLADFLMLQLYMFPFNSSDAVTLEYGGSHNEVIYINHTVPNPDFLPMRELYNFTMNFDYEMTWQEG